MAISSNNVLIPGTQRTYTGTTPGFVYRFKADVNYVSYAPSTGIPTTGTTQDSLIIYSVNSGGGLTRLKAVRYNLLTATVPVSLTFTAPVGSVSIKAEFIPGNAGLSSGRAYVVDNLRLTRMSGTNLYTSNFAAGTIVSQNTDGWSANWATTYMNVLTGSPNKLRVTGETPVIQRTFPVSPNNDYELTYTQTENNSVTFAVEQSSNGTTGWSSLVSSTSMNGTQTKYFTPTQAFVRVRYSGSAAYSLANMKLVGIDVDTMYTLIARGSYRYAFQGQERDDEIKGAGNSYNYEYRMHDPRLGRFFAIDPLAGDYPHNSPYAFSENVVINAVELEGLEKYIVTFTTSEVTKQVDNKAVTYYQIFVSIKYVLQKDRKPSSPKSDDKDRQADYYFNGNQVNLPTGFSRFSPEFELSQLAFKSERLIGSDGKPLEDRYGGYTLEESVEANGGNYVKSVETKEDWTSLYSDPIEIPKAPQVFEVGQEERNMVAAANFIQALPFVSVQIRSSFLANETISDARTRSSNLKNNIISEATHTMVPNGGEQKLIDNINKQVTTVDGNVKPQVISRYAITYSISTP